MNKVYCFDVDGTLTPSRELISEEMKCNIIELAKLYPVYFVTGSDYAKTLEQVGPEVLNAIMMSMNCNCSSLWKNGIQVSHDDWKLTPVETLFLSDEVKLSKYAIKTGKHIEHRPGMVNFSIVGRNANKEQRQSYKIWDKEMNERAQVAERFNNRFDKLEAKVAGETGLDIAAKGNDKSRAIEIIGTKDPIYFYGDKMEVDGNDYPLARRIQYESLGKTFCVSRPEETLEHIKREIRQ